MAAPRRSGLQRKALGVQTKGFCFGSAKMESRLPLNAHRPCPAHGETSRWAADQAPQMAPGIVATQVINAINSIAALATSTAQNANSSYESNSTKALSFHCTEGLAVMGERLAPWVLEKKPAFHLPPSASPWLRQARCFHPATEHHGYGTPRREHRHGVPTRREEGGGADGAAHGPARGVAGE